MSAGEVADFEVLGIAIKTFVGAMTKVFAKVTRNKRKKSVDSRLSIGESKIRGQFWSKLEKCLKSLILSTVISLPS